MAISCVVPWNVAQFLDRSWLIPTCLALSLDQLHHLDMAELYWAQVENCGGVLQLLLSHDSFGCSFHHPIGFSSLTVVPGGHFLPTDSFVKYEEIWRHMCLVTVLLLSCPATPDRDVLLCCSGAYLSEGSTLLLSLSLSFTDTFKD